MDNGTRRWDEGGEQLWMMGSEVERKTQTFWLPRLKDERSMMNEARSMPDVVIAASGSYLPFSDPHTPFGLVSRGRDLHLASSACLRRTPYAIMSRFEYGSRLLYPAIDYLSEGFHKVLQRTGLSC
jgi:hypothetical protein